MTHTKANKSKILMLVLGLTMCLALMLGIVVASPTFAAHAEGETDTRIVITDELVPVTDLVKAFTDEVQEPTFGGRLVRGTDYEVEYAVKTGSTGSLFWGKPVDAGTYIVTVTGKGDYSGSFTKEFVINKAEQSAPVGLFANSIQCNEGLGTIIGVTIAMEYRKVGDADFTACTSTTITGLVAGEYEIRYKEDDNYLAGAVTKVSVVINHNFGVIEERQEPSCSATGTEAHYYCSRCEKYFDESKNEKTLEELTIPATDNHTYGSWIDEIPATTENFGTKGHKDCTVCEKHFDKDGNEITDLGIAKIGTYTVTVTGGTATPNKAEYQENVTVTANAPEVGKEFDKWVVTGITLSNTDLTRSTLTFKMPENDVTFTATYKDVVYRVTVIDGTATHEMATYQTEVTITANEPDADMYFDKWEVTGLDTTGMDLTKTEIKFQMPANNVTFTATYLTHIKYEILVVDGTKDKSPVMAGETVTITANPAKPGKVFDKWTCETAGVTIEFANATSRQTTFVMPAKDIEIRAHFRDEGTAPSVEIKVDGGTGAGTYKPGDSVTITANEPAEGKVFKGWKDEKGEIVSTEKSYTFTVSGEVSLTAVYEDKPTGGDGTGDGNETPEPDKDGLSTGAIVGIAVGSVAVAGLGGFAVLWFAVKKKTFADLGVALKKGFTAIGNFFKSLGGKIKAKFNKKK